MRGGQGADYKVWSSGVSRFLLPKVARSIRIIEVLGLVQHAITPDQQ